jgi:hypothetical protein
VHRHIPSSCIGPRPLLSNRSFDTDAQIRPCASRTSSLCAGQVRRYVSATLHHPCISENMTLVIS